jgi:AraC-like DNA-binding protein
VPAALAGQAGVSVSKLKLLFHRVCGVPPFGYLRRVRMEKARELLIYSRMNVTEVALEVGYTSLSHFSKAFTAHYGMSPSQVRRDRPAVASDGFPR